MRLPHEATEGRQVGGRHRTARAVDTGGFADDVPEASEVRAFVTDGRQGVNYRAGTWHAIHSVLEREGEFLVVDRGGADNLDERPMAIRVVV